MRASSLLKRLASPAVPAYGFKGLNAIAAFVATALLARHAGPAVVGDYGFAVVTATLIALVAMRGLDFVALREIAGALRQKDSAAAAGILFYAQRWMLVAGLLLSLGWAALAATTPVAAQLAVDRGALIAAGLGIGSAALHKLGLGVLRGIGKPVAGQFFEGFNSLLFAGLVAAVAWQGFAIDARTAVLFFFGCQLVAVAFIWLLIRSAARVWQARTQADGKALTAAGLPMMATQGMQMFSDWLLLALIAGAASAADMGAMRVAMQIVIAITLVLTTGETYLAAKVAGDIRAGRPDLVWSRHRRASLAMLIAFGPLMLVCVIFPEQLLSLAFGPAFVVAAPALAILSLGQASKAITGPVGGLLSMAGHERVLFLTTTFGVVLLVALALLLVPILGLTGAAIAHATTATVRNIANYLGARRYIPRSPPPAG